MADKKAPFSHSASDYKCGICLMLLIEPVVLPCKHEMCRTCFQKNVAEANFLCPMCRKRISSWARRSMREEKLVDQNRWDQIQKLFPEKCSKRLRSNGDDESDDECPPVKRVLAKCGELRQEYEEEIKKIRERKEKEEEASKNLIRKILKEQNQQWQQQIVNERLPSKLSMDSALKKARIGKKSKGTPSTESHQANEQQVQDSDYKFAVKLQKQFDNEANPPLKRDEYLLRSSGQNVKKIKAMD